MGSKEMKKAVLQEKLELLRSVTKSQAVNNASIIVDATKYIEELKQKVEESEQQLAEDNELPKVTVTPQETGFLINVFSQQSCPGLLVSVLEAFDDIGLEVLDANVSCTDTFHLAAVGGEVSCSGLPVACYFLFAFNHESTVDAQKVRQVVVQAIKKCMETAED